MILRDGRNEVHHLGPRRTFQPSLMPMLAGVGETTGSGGWDGASHSRLFTGPKPPPQTQAQRNAYNRAWRQENLEECRRRERERQRRYKARKRAARMAP